jgi:hypothetical protein
MTTKMMKKTTSTKVNGQANSPRAKVVFHKMTTRAKLKYLKQAGDLLKEMVQQRDGVGDCQGGDYLAGLREDIDEVRPHIANPPPRWKETLEEAGEAIADQAELFEWFAAEFDDHKDKDSTKEEHRDMITRKVLEGSYCRNIVQQLKRMANPLS